MQTTTTELHDQVTRFEAPIRSMKQLVYIASCWHSGSTLLDMLLGANGEVTSLGEVGKLSHVLRGLWGGNVRCSCGEMLGECPFWVAVQERLRARTGDPELTLSGFPISHLVEHESIHRRIPRLPEVLLLLGSRGLWRLAAGGSAAVGGYLAAARNAYAMFDTIAAMNHTPVIVDSSKEPAQLKSLYLADRERFRVIHLVRDGRAVALSLIKGQDLNPQQAARKWVRFNWNLQAVLTTIPRDRIRLVRYEDICRDTAGTLRGLAEFCGFQLTIDPSKIVLNKDKYHIVAGNPMRLRWQEMNVRLDEKWQTELSAVELARIEPILRKMNRSFGYR